MPKLYKNIDGWFDFEDVYDYVLHKFPQNSTFVEVGSWLGKSTCYMAELLKEQNSNNRFFAVDTFKGSVGDAAFNDVLQQNNGSVLNLFNANLKSANVNDYVIPIATESVIAAKAFNNESLDFVFLDGAHDYDSVFNDLKAWFPKIKKTGLIGGHDFGHPPLTHAIYNFFRPLNLMVYKVNGPTSKTSWICLNQ